MRKFLIALALAVGVAGNVGAADLSNLKWTRFPTDREGEDAYPPQAINQAVDGHAKMKCAVTPKGTLESCIVIEENPIGLGFGQAILGLASTFALKPRMVGGVPETGTVVVGFFFKNPEQESRYAGMEFVDPIWSATPTPQEMADAYPASIRGQGVTGQVMLHCAVLRAGGLKDCKAQSENPEGRGFADAAKSLSSRFRLTPPKDSRAVMTDAHVRVSFEFADPSKAPGQPRLITHPRWVRTPDPDKVLELFPAKAVAAGVTTGRGTVDCVIDATGKLTECASIKEEPTGLDFGVSAVVIASLLSINPWTSEGQPAEGAHLRVPIRFNLHPDDPEPASPGK